MTIAHLLVGSRCYKMKVLFKSLVLTYHDIVVFLLHGMKNINLTSLSLSVCEAGDNNVNISIAVVCGNSATKRETRRRGSKHRDVGRLPILRE